MQKNPVVCVLVFIIAAILLGTAYYKVTAGVRTISDFQGLGIQIAKGIIGTFLVFWSVSGDAACNREAVQTVLL